jgi:hypothetical protein
VQSTRANNAHRTDAPDITLKARRELASLQFGFDEQDACDVLANLSAEDFRHTAELARDGRMASVFKPQLAGMVLYVKLILRSDCVVISFHEDEPSSPARSRPR